MKLRKKPKPAKQNRETRTSRAAVAMLENTGPTTGRNGSFRNLLRREYFNAEDGAKDYRGDLLNLAVNKAQRGDFFFWNKLVELHESDAVTHDDLAEFVDRIYNIVRRNVEQLDGGKECLISIARDIQKEKL